jgi:hypothetical protein
LVTGPVAWRMEFAFLQAGCFVLLLLWCEGLCDLWWRTHVCLCCGLKCLFVRVWDV